MEFKLVGVELDPKADQEKFLVLFNGMAKLFKDKLYENQKLLVESKVYVK